MMTAIKRKQELRDIFGALCHDETPMVRRAAASYLGAFAQVVEKEHIIASIIPLFTALSQDDQDSVRLLAIENCCAVGNLLDEDAITGYILGPIFCLVRRF